MDNSQLMKENPATRELPVVWCRMYDSEAMIFFPIKLEKHIEFS
jgi:hypothetical protein